jgi:hypothetical protein
MRTTSVFITGCRGEAIVCCPKCGGRALLDEPFAFYPPGIIPAQLVAQAHTWGQRLVVEKYPSVVKWPHLERGQGYVHKRGVVKCLGCHHIEAHDIAWPDEAYYKWDIRGQTLWACNREHAQVLLDFLGSKGRDASRHPGYVRSLRKLPKEFISAKVRDDIVKAISRTLESESV